jgi:hypothetical protein
MRRILLVEPGYKNKYPPLGLMKIASYHKLRSDHVEFAKGCIEDKRNQRWDRVYVASLFTFHWRVTVETILFYGASVTSMGDVYVGGVLASLLGRELSECTGATVLQGLIDRPGVLDFGDSCIVDHLIPDYSILDEIEYKYGVQDAYFGYATRGCPNRCSFCAVGTIEPSFVPYCPIAKQVRGIEEVYGPKKDLLLLDNNVLASDCLPRIVGDIRDLGFERGSKVGRKRRRLDFNQGLDIRRFDVTNAALLSTTCIDPLRFAFDSLSDKKSYVQAIETSVNHGLVRFSTYILYNYRDTPEDFYERLRTNVVLNEDLGSKISGFPMRFIPLDAKTRGFIGVKWNRQLLRGVSCILAATRGMVSPRLEFFEAAFGRNAEEFRRIASMPEHYIVHRRRHESDGAAAWASLYSALSPGERSEFEEALACGPVRDQAVCGASTRRLRKLLEHYLGGKNPVPPIS